MTPLERLARNTDRSGECWLWLRRRNKDGYGVTEHDGRTIGAHRFAYLVLVGPIPDGLQLDHLCKIPACVNPAHLEPVTPRENVHRSSRYQPQCPNGHPYDDTARRTNGTRTCRPCHADRQRAYRAARRLSAQTISSGDGRIMQDGVQFQVVAS